MEPFKNAFSFANASVIADRIRAVEPRFSLRLFRKGLEKELEPLELKSRMQVVGRRIEVGLSPSVSELFATLVQALDPGDGSGLKGFQVWPLTDIVARRGLEDFDAAMSALRAMTRVFTAEFAIRPFLRHEQKRTLEQLKCWSSDPDEHVRRLVSEGSRPMLPWGERLPELMANPNLALPLLERLHRDPSDYVRLSVSNHLNDFSKYHPELVLETLERWRSTDGKFLKLARHACRTLIKQGHIGALKFHGYGAASSIELIDFQISTTRLKVGSSLGYRLQIKNGTPERVRVLFDYAIFHRKASGATTPKVFKGRTRELAGGEVWEIAGQHPIRPITTRVYHAGQHSIEPRINGVAFEARAFELDL